jgi:hypothetical protein
MRKIFFVICIFSTIYLNGQTVKRILPIPTTPQPCRMGTCAPISKTSDGGYILNYSYGYPNWDVAGPIYSEIVKTDSSFIPMWRKELIGENGKKTFSFNDGTSIIYSKGSGVNIEKIDNAGNTLWLKKYNRTDPYSLMINNAIYNSSKIKLAGCVMRYNGFGNWDYSSSFLMNLDTAGNFIQADSLVVSSFANTSIEDLTNDSLGNYYIMGSGMSSNGNSFVAKITSTNTVVWCKKLKSSTYAHSYSASTILNNGDLLIGGNLYNSTVGTSAIILLRFSTNGALIWSKTINYPSLVGSVQQIPNGNILLSGSLRAAYGDTLKNIVIKLDSNGNALWTKSYDAGFSMSSAYQKSNDNWFFSAYTTAPILFNIDSAGSSYCPSFNFSIAFYNLPVTVTSITCTLNPIIITSTTTLTNSISGQSYIDTCSNLTTSIAESQYSDKITVYPNPTTGLINIISDRLIDEIKVTNIFGQTVYQAKPNNDKSSFYLNNSGLYFISVTSDKHVTTKKMTVEH